MIRVTIVVICIAAWLLQVVHGGKQALTFKHDTRQQIHISDFGYTAGGMFNLEVLDWSNTTFDQTKFFYIDVTDSFTAPVLEMVPCDTLPVRSHQDQSFKFGLWQRSSYVYVVEPKTVGVHTLYFINCDQTETTFSLKLEQYNVDKKGMRNYLSIGSSSDPVIYAAFFVAYAAMLVIWIVKYMRGDGNVVNRVHHRMSYLAFFKCLSVFFYALEQHFIQFDGSSNGWDVAYYLFAVLKTLFFFTVVAVLGTGVPFFKPSLARKERILLAVQFPVLILISVAMLNTIFYGISCWNDIYRIADIVLCSTLLIPIIWTYKEFKAAAENDERATVTAQLFRRFFLVVVIYIYMTRVIVYLLEATVQYNMVFACNMLNEGITFAFYCVVGYMFRPMSANPYFRLAQDSNEKSKVDWEKMQVQLLAML